MSNVWFCSDLHFGHKNIQKMRKEVSSSFANEFRIASDWAHCVTKRDIVYVLGDAVFDHHLLPMFSELPGTKYLVRGNHDELTCREYLSVFKEVYGLKKYHEFWLSHAPIHPDELRGRVNLHGHTHYVNMRVTVEIDTGIGVMEEQAQDSRYFNCCPENLWKLFNCSLVSLDQIRKHLVK